MELFDWFKSLFGKKQRSKRWRGRPLYKVNGITYWKGIRVDDDLFENVRCDPKELKAYNFWVRKLNRKIKYRKAFRNKHKFN